MMSTGQSIVHHCLCLVFLNYHIMWGDNDLTVLISMNHNILKHSHSGALLIPVFTHLSDLYGRRKLFLFTLWVASITAIACSMAPTIITFLACRFILGVATAVYFHKAALWSRWNDWNSDLLQYMREFLMDNWNNLGLEKNMWACKIEVLFNLDLIFSAINWIWVKRDLKTVTSANMIVAKISSNKIGFFHSVIFPNLIRFQGIYAVIWIMCCESVAIEFRSLIPVAYTVAWVLGIMLVGILRIWILNWRWLYFTISIPSILSVFYYWFVN